MRIIGYHVRLLLLSFIAVLFLDFICMASNDDNFKLTNRDKALGMHFTDDKNGWTVGDHGFVLRTEDGGHNWQKITISEESFNDVCFCGDYGWIVGSRGLILHSVNAGKSWDKQASDTEVSLMRVLFLDKMKGFTVGADGNILRTTDAGSTWAIIAFDWMNIIPEALLARGIISINLYDIFFINETNGWIVGDWGTILHTVDGGTEWHLSHIGPFPSLYSICFNNDKKGWAVGQNGFSLETDDGGGIWKNVVIEGKNSLYRIRIANGYGVIVGDQGTLYNTNNGGQTWDRFETGLRPPYPWLADTWILPSNSAKVLSIGKGIILKTAITAKK